jgi:outer membrane cobalamin receptor
MIRPIFPLVLLLLPAERSPASQNDTEAETIVVTASRSEQKSSSAWDGTV